MNIGVGKVGTFHFYKNIINDLNGVQADFAKLANQISSGRAINEFSELAENEMVSPILEFLGRSQRNDDYVSNNNLVLGRMNQMDRSLKTIFDIGSDFKAKMTLRLSPAGKTMHLTRLLNDGLLNIENALNANFMGRYIFSGSQTDKAAAADLMNKSNIMEGKATTNYCLADNVVLNVRANDNFLVDYGVTAYEDGFKNLIGAANLAKEADAINDQDGLRAALDLLDEAIDGISTIRTKVGNNSKVIEDINESHKNIKEYLNSVLNKNLNTDITQAAIKSATDETIMRASYSVYARMASLNLADYLK